MKSEKIELKFPEGNYITAVDIFDKSDLSILIDIYDSWRNLSEKLKKINARSVNLPEGLSEVAFCIFMDCVRLNNPKLGSKVNTSFDVYSLKNQKRIQIKACSVVPDLTSFGPKSQWDELYFIDFYREGSWDYSFDIYLIPNDLVYNQKVNEGQTLKQMQGEGKRPRFSIYTDIIKKLHLEPIKTCYLNAD